MAWQPPTPRLKFYAAPPPLLDAGKAGSMEAALRKLCAEVEAAVRDGCQCVVLSDRAEGGAGATTPERAPIPSLLATGAVHHHLIKTFQRSNTSIVVDTAQVGWWASGGGAGEVFGGRW